MKRKIKASGRSAKKSRFDSLHDLLILKLQALHDVEQQLTKALPTMAKRASSPELKEAFESHLQETKEQVRRLERAMKHLGVSPKTEKVAAIRGLVEDGSWVMKHVEDDAARDAALIAAAQYVERYETAGYGTAREWARLMGHTQVEELLSQSLEEEEAANQKLTELAESGINDEANDMQRESLTDKAKNFFG